MKNLFMLTGFLVIGTSLGFFTINREYLSPSKAAKSLISKGKIYLEQSSKESCQKAIEKFSSVISNYTNTPEAKDAMYYLAEAYEKMGNTNIALKKFQELSDFQLKSEMREKINFKIAKLKILKSYTDEGISALTALLRKSKDAAMRSEIYNELGKYYAKNDKLEEAEKNFKIALKENGSFSEVQLNLAEILVKSGKYKEAHIVYANFLEFLGDIDPNDKELLKQFRMNVFNTGKTLYLEKKYENALDFFSLITQNFSNTKESEESHYYSASIFLIQKDFSKANMGFETVLRNDVFDRDSEALLKQGEIYFQLKNFSKAASVFRKVQSLFAGTQAAQAAKEWEDEIRRVMLDESEFSKIKNNISENKVENSTQHDTKKQEESNTQKEPETYKNDEPIELEYTIVPADEFERIEEPSLLSETNHENSLITP